MNRAARRAALHSHRHPFGKHSARVRPSNLERRREYLGNCGEKCLLSFLKGRGQMQRTEPVESSEG